MSGKGKGGKGEWRDMWDIFPSVLGWRRLGRAIGSCSFSCAAARPWVARATLLIAGVVGRVQPKLGSQRFR